jgi:beta-fructofuranosidase
MKYEFVNSALYTITDYVYNDYFYFYTTIIIDILMRLEYIEKVERVPQVHIQQECVMEFNSSDYKKLYVFAKRWEDNIGYLHLNDPAGEKQTERLMTDNYRLVQFHLTEESNYQFDYQGVTVSQMYLSDCDGLMERGVCFLNPQTGTTVTLSDWYDSAIREQYHFGPFVNWANDPNGLCWYQGYYHLFYQCNPFEQVWSDMFWGHAVSRDLVHWIHLPHVLEPQQELCQNKALKGGAFSGSAVVTDEAMLLYLTRHEGPLTDGEATRQWQTKAICRDGISVTGERTIIEDKPPGAGYDFRDPKVQMIDGHNYMVLAAALDAVPSILLYEETKPDKWLYQGPLVQESEKGITTFECPDFFKLDGAYVGIGAWMFHHDAHGRYQMTKCYIGSFDGQQLHVQQKQWLDFGSNCYAVQTFEHDGRRLAIGWISDFYDEHVELENGARGSFTLPRELSVRDNHLHMIPAKECYALLDRKLAYDPFDERKNGLVIPGNCYYVHATLKGDQPFKLVLAHDGEDTLSLVRESGQVQLVSSKKAMTGIHFPSDVTGVREIEAFVDRRVVEVFLNKGEGAGTKLFYQTSKEGYLKADFYDGDLERMEVWTVSSIW